MSPCRPPTQEVLIYSGPESLLIRHTLVKDRREKTHLPSPWSELSVKRDLGENPQFLWPSLYAHVENSQG